MKVSDRYKHSSLIQYEINYSHKMFYRESYCNVGFSPLCYLRVFVKLFVKFLRRFLDKIFDLCTVKVTVTNNLMVRRHDIHRSDTQHNDTRYDDTQHKGQSL